MFQFYKTLLLILLIFSFPAYSLHIVVNSNCKNGAIPFNFDKYSFAPAHKINFDSFAINPDYKFNEVERNTDADIVFKVDGVGDTLVCRSNKGRTIKISRYSYNSDITVQLSKFRSFNDSISIYNDSELTIEEAIAILIVPSLPLLDFK